MLSVTRPLDFMSCSDPGQVFPLAVFDVNVGTDLFNPMRSYMGIPKPKKDVWTQDRLHRHPIVQRREAEPVRRRQAFLRKVREAGDDKKWQTRSDQILREDFVTQQKQWLEELERSAPTEPLAVEEEENEVQLDASGMQEVEMVDEILTEEEREFEALICLMTEKVESKHEQEHGMSDYGSEEEDYDDLFLDALAEADAQSDMVVGRNDQPSMPLESDMDLSLG